MAEADMADAHIPDEDIVAPAPARKAARRQEVDSPSKGDARSAGLQPFSANSLAFAAAAVTGGASAALKDLLNNQTAEVRKVLDSRVKPLEEEVGALRCYSSCIHAEFRGVVIGRSH